MPKTILGGSEKLRIIEKRGLHKVGNEMIKNSPDCLLDLILKAIGGGLGSKIPVGLVW